MPYEFRLPDIGEGVAEGEIVRWFVKEGDEIREDAPLVSVLTDKANVEIPSPKAGRVVRLHAQVGEKVKVGGLLVTIEPVGGSAPAGAPIPAPSPPSPAPSATATAAPPATPDREVPPMPAPTSPAAAPTGPVLASPYLRRLAAERGIDLRTIRGSGPGGRLVEADLSTPPAPGGPAIPSDHSNHPPASPASPGGPPPPAPTIAVPAASGGSPEETLQRIPIRGLRRVIADHMAESVHKAAHFTYVEEVDVSELVRLRERMAKHVEKQGVRLSFLPFLIKGVVAGLRAHPRLNATVDDARNELVLHPSYHIGIATAGPDGLIVPVIHHAEGRSLLQLARDIQDLGDRGRAGKLTRAELTGGTFTITSLGALGGVLATPILNYPEVGILGVHRIFRRPVYRPDGTIGPADLMNLSVSLDHRLIDGIEGAQFLATVKGYLEDPHQLFAEMA